MNNGEKIENLEIVKYKTRKQKKIAQLVMSIFIISLSFGDNLALFGIKIAYYSTTIILFMSLLQNARKILYYFNTKLTKLFIPWIFYGLVQLIWCNDVNSWSYYYKTLIINIVIVVIILSYIRTLDDLRFINTVYIVSGAISIIIGIWEINTGNHIVGGFGTEWDISYYGNKPFAFYGNLNNFATIMVFLIMSVLLDIFLSKRKFGRIIIDITIIILAMYEIIITKSRGSYYSAIILFVAFPLGLFLARTYRKKGLVFKISFIVLSCCLLFGIIYLFSSSGLQWLISKVSTNSGDIVSDLYRYQITMKGIRALINTMGFGIGAGQSIPIVGIPLHNMFLEIIVEYGVIIGGCFLYLLFSMVYKTRNNYNFKIDALLKIFPLIMLVGGISASGASILRNTWITISIFYALAEKPFRVNILS